MCMMKIKKILALGIIGCMMTCLYGCSKVNLSDEEEALYVAYAAGVVVNHDNNYILNLKDVEIETETETTWNYEKPGTTLPNQSQGGNNGNNEEETTAIIVNTDLNPVINMTGLDVTYKDYEITKQYPNGDNLSFVMKAVDGSNLVVLKFNVKNTTSSDIDADFLGQKIRFKGIFNGNVMANCQTTLLNNAMNTYSGTIPAGSTQELVLIYEVSDNSLTNISTIKLEIKNEDLSDTIILKK